jgi:hypothetical protein
MNPTLGRNFEALDPLEWLARMGDHIPDPGQHRTMFYGEYANLARGARQRSEAAAGGRSCSFFRAMRPLPGMSRSPVPPAPIAAVIR